MLKKKYRQMLQERDGRHPRADVDAQRRPSTGTAPWDAMDAPAVSSGLSDSQVNFTPGRVDSATALQNPKVSERTIGWAALTLHINIYRRILSSTKGLFSLEGSLVSSYQRKGKVIWIYLKGKPMYRSTSGHSELV